MYDETLKAVVGGGINLALDKILADSTPALRRVFEQASGAYSRLKQERQVLDFDDLEQMALCLLEERPEVCERWQAEVRALLVDEYQDTNDRQRKLVNRLNAGSGKLFIVGDAKQSIYRFRGAEVAVFREERSRIEAGGGRGFTLATSYRAHKGLVSGLNDLLRPVLDEEEDPARPWREPFAPLAPYRQEARKGFSEPFVELQLTVGSKSDGALRRAAAALGGQMVDLVEQQDNGLSYGDFAVLCRASTSFGPYEDAFDEAGVPYLTVAGRGFYYRPEIRDLLNALQVLADPTDNLALIGFLRSPVMGFSDIELYQLTQESKKATRTRSLWHWIKQNEQVQLLRAVELISKLHKLAGRIPVAGLLKALLDETEYRAALLQAGYPRPARNVAKLLRDAHASGIVSVGEFLEYVEGIRTAAAREGEARATAGNVVRIMTIHAAKGLEFPVVIIGDINHSRPFRNNLIIDSKLGVLPPITDEEDRLPGLYRLLSNQENDREEAESQRLFYVAATRAQEKLILNGCIRLTNGSKPGWLKGWLKEVAAPLELSQQVINYNSGGGRAIQLDLVIAATPVACIIFEPAYTPVQTKPSIGRKDLANVSWSPALIESLYDKGLQDEREVESFKRGALQRVWSVLPQDPNSEAPAWIVGRLVHDALALWRFPGPNFDAWIRSRAREYGLVDDYRLKQAVERTHILLARFKEHRLYDELMDADRCLHEIPYSLLDDMGEVKQGLIDILYQRNDRWTLVEFKTDKIAQRARLEQHLREHNYFSQVKKYAEAVEWSIGQRPRTILCLLDCEEQIYLDYDNSLEG
jgi:ATP-dependent exoDNAse (exonuclease V) beta subunit